MAATIPARANSSRPAVRFARFCESIFAFQVIAAVLLLANRYVPLAVAVLAPVIVNILVFHALMAPSGLPLALFVAALWAVIFVDVRPAFTGLFQSRVDRSSTRSTDLSKVPVRAN